VSDTVEITSEMNTTKPVFN